MYKKDYELIAATIKAQVQQIEMERRALLADTQMSDRNMERTICKLEGRRDALGMLVYELAERLGKENAKFNPTVFIVKCGVKD